MSRVGRTKSILWVILRWPLLLAFCLFMSIDLTCYVAVRQWVRWYEWAITWRGSRRRLRQKMMEATNYKDYKTAAAALDEFLKNKTWKQEEICPHYDVDLVHRTTTTTSSQHSPTTPAAVSTSARANATRDVMKILQHGACKHNFGGIENEQLYSHTYLGTKYLVEGFLDEVCKNLQRVAESPDVSEDEKHEFFKKAARNYGRTALCLSGGASLGYYHVGVVKSLFDEKLLPNIITGTSAGSLIAALICCRTDEELVEEVFVPSIHKILTACDIPYLERFKRLYRTGAMFDHREWFQKIMLATKGPLTFWEAYQRTGRVLNIPIVPDEPHSPFKLCNYITTPNVLIATAVMASSAVPGILNPVELLQKNEAGQITAFTGSGRKWRDGSLKMDIPERELHRLWNVNFTIVSQVNPHIVLFFFDRKGSAGSPTAHRYGQGWRGGFVASALVHHFKLDLQKWMSLLKDLELLPRVLGTDVSDVFLQRFEGDVTIVPRPQLADYQNILTDPTNERMKWYIERGEARSWPKLNMIANRMRVERALAGYRRRFAEPTTPGGGVRSTTMTTTATTRAQSPGRTLGGGVEKRRRRSSGMSAIWGGARSVSVGGGLGGGGGGGNGGDADKMKWPQALGDALEQDMEGDVTITE
ncbi:acyl transferase/acyl hydrolase/lysophospholipase [Geranomyces variabilis]|nr:acyl transferase/acyl hydrolase/lysophospholipase [Geranomyces variabilis]